MNRGSPLRLDPLGRLRIASMRPRFMNRGSIVTGVGPRSRSKCFNEAPIHESGKCYRRGKYDTERRRFNEAPIHESGK